MLQPAPNRRKRLERMDLVCEKRHKQRVLANVSADVDVTSTQPPCAQGRHNITHEKQEWFFKRAVEIYCEFDSVPQVTFVGQAKEIGRKSGIRLLLIASDYAVG